MQRKEEREIRINRLEYKTDKEFKNKVLKELDEAVKYITEEEVETTIYISNIISSDACKIFDIEAEEFNGWECDWWSEFYHKGERVGVFGCAWYGKLEFSLEL